MTALRVLHVDDEPDIREVVDLSLSLDPIFAVRSCDRGRDAVATAIDWPPDLILIDVMMPDMDGPATLVSLRRTPQTADIPVVFMTARAQSSEMERLKALGATGVIAKPFDPMTLAATVRGYMHGGRDLRTGFLARLRSDVAALARPGLRAEAAASPALLDGIKAFAQALQDAAGVLGLDELVLLGSGLGEAVSVAMRADGSFDGFDGLERALEGILAATGQPLSPIDKVLNGLDCRSADAAISKSRSAALK